MTTSTLTRIDGTPYKVGDKLTSIEEALEFAEACGWRMNWYFSDDAKLTDRYGDDVQGWELEQGEGLPYTIVGFHFAHIAKPAPVEPVGLVLQQVLDATKVKVGAKGGAITETLTRRTDWRPDQLAILYACFMAGEVTILEAGEG
jgi:hypothetical protein